MLYFRLILLARVAGLLEESELKHEAKPDLGMAVRVPGAGL